MMAGRWIWAVGGVAAIAGIGAGVAFAQGEMRHRGGWHGERGGDGGMFRRARTKDDVLERARARFARIDANSDGIIDREEIGAMIERRMDGRRSGRGMERRGERMLRRFDTDRDGRVTEQEIRSHVAERFARNDIDADGAMTDADLPPMLRGRNLLKADSGWTPRRRWARRLERLRQANVNNDDRVTLEEVQAMAIARFARFDANKDGAIDDGDRSARRAEIKDYRVSRMLARFGAAGQDSIQRDAFIAEVEKRFARRDIDGDGVISRDERRGWGRGERGRHHGWRHRGERRDGAGRGRHYEERGHHGPRHGGDRGEGPGPERNLDWSPDSDTDDGLDTDVQRDARFNAGPHRSFN